MKKSFSIAMQILSDIGKLVNPEHDFYLPLTSYWYDRDEIFSCKWPSLPSITGQKKIVHHLAELANIIAKITKVNWMTFIIQSPYSTSDNFASAFRYHNFGVANAKREDWNKWIEAKETFTFTKLFFGENLTPETYSKIFCVKIDRSNSCSIEKVSHDNLILINVTLDVTTQVN